MCPEPAPGGRCRAPSRRHPGGDPRPPMSGSGGLRGRSVRGSGSDSGRPVRGPVPGPRAVRSGFRTRSGVRFRTGCHASGSGGFRGGSCLARAGFRAAGSSPVPGPGPRAPRTPFRGGVPGVPGTVRVWTGTGMPGARPVRSEQDPGGGPAPVRCPLRGRNRDWFGSDRAPRPGPPPEGLLPGRGPPGTGAATRPSVPSRAVPPRVPGPSPSPPGRPASGRVRAPGPRPPGR